MRTETRIPVRVYIEDTDAGGIVYYVNYLKYFERARTEMLREMGFDKAALPAMGSLFVVHSTQIKYLSPARLDDLLEAIASISDLGRSFIEFDQSVERGGERLCEAKVKIACVDHETFRPRRIPAAIVAALRTAK